jgi:hypothetical protein
VGFPFYQDRLEPPLKQMANPFVNGETTGTGLVNVLNGVKRLNGLNDLNSRHQKQLPIGVSEKHFLTRVAAARQMIERTSKF